MKWMMEVVQDFDGSYYANLTMGGTDYDGNYHEPYSVKGLPEYVDYRTLAKGIENKTGIIIPKRKNLQFVRSGFGRKKYAYVDATQTRPNGACVTSDEVENGWKPDFT